MKRTSSYFLSISVIPLILLSGSGCETSALVEINPLEDPSAFSRSLLIEGGKNRNGDVPTTNEPSELVISKSQPSATVSSDNFLFIPFLATSSEGARGVYLQIEGADNYWEIPLSSRADSASSSSKNSTNTFTEVLSIGIPENVQEGIFNISYQLFGSNGKTGAAAMLKTNVTFPIDYCESGEQIGQVEGQDGISAQSYSLGDDPGFITIDYETFTVPDRVDIRYNKQWIRSTGELLAGAAPPIKECANVVAGDGFLGTSGVFHIFYDPKVSKKIDVYVSGCLDGGTQWNYNIVECPKEKPIIGIHSNSPPESELVSGHAWISLTRDGTTQFYGLWPDAHGDVEDNGNGTDIRINQERGFGRYSRFLPIDEDQLDRLNFKLGQNETWAYTYNCSSWAEEVYEYVTNENVSADEFITGSPLETPRKLSEGILELERRYPTSNYRPEDIGEDSSSCSFCF